MVDCSLLCVQFGNFDFQDEGGFDEVAALLGRNCVSLTSVNWSTSLISNEGLKALTLGCRSIEMLDVNSCVNLGDDGIVALAQNSFELKYLDLTKTKVTVSGIERLVTLCTKVTHLILNYVDGIDDMTMRLIMNFDNLTHLELMGTSIGDLGIFFLFWNNMSICENIQYLNLSCTVVTDDTLLLLATMCRNLEYLDLKFTNVSDENISSTDDLQSIWSTVEFSLEKYVSLRSQINLNPTMAWGWGGIENFL
jgi:hypothetical protein